MSSNFQYKETINSIIEKFSKGAIKPKKIVPVQIKNHTYHIPKDLDLFFTFHGIEGESDVGLAPVIYELLTVPLKNKYNCTFRLYINITEKTVEWDSGEKDSGVNRVWYYYKNPETLIPVINLILDQSKKCGSFSTIPVIIYGRNSYGKEIAHRNIILLERIPKNLKDHTEIVLNYYEPYGSVDKKGASKFIATVLNQIERASKGRIKVNYKGTSCPLGGIQTKMERGELDIGYCIMYSYFWIYIVLSVILDNLEHGRYESSINWINEVERYYANKSPEILYKACVNFADWLVKNYMAILARDRSKEEYKYILRKIKNSRELEIEEYMRNEREEKDEDN